MIPVLSLLTDLGCGSAHAWPRTWARPGRGTGMFSTVILARVVRTDRCYRFFAVFLAAFFAAFFAMFPPGMWLLSFGLCVRVSQQVG